MPENGSIYGLPGGAGAGAGLSELAGTSVVVCASIGSCASIDHERIATRKNSLTRIPLKRIRTFKFFILSLIIKRSTLGLSHERNTINETTVAAAIASELFSGMASAHAANHLLEMVCFPTANGIGTEQREQNPRPEVRLS